MASEPDPGPADGLPVEVRRSGRRRRTVSAIERDGTLVVMIPASMSAIQERHWVEVMRGRWRQRAERGVPRTDGALMDRARELSQRYLGGRARPSAVRWVGNQQHRWGSCTPATGVIRLSRALEGMPVWVQDYVLLHELAHVIEAGHGPAFWALLEAYPRTERARGYLEGVTAAKGLTWGDDDVGGAGDDVG